MHNGNIFFFRIIFVLQSKNVDFIAFFLFFDDFFVVLIFFEKPSHYAVLGKFGEKLQFCKFFMNAVCDCVRIKNDHKILWSGYNQCRVQGAECRVLGAGCRVQSAGCRVQGTGCRVQGARCRVQGAECRVQSAGCRVITVGEGLLPS